MYQETLKAKGADIVGLYPNWTSVLPIKYISKFPKSGFIRLSTPLNNHYLTVIAILSKETHGPTDIDDSIMYFCLGTIPIALSPFKVVTDLEKMEKLRNDLVKKAERGITENMF
jgi:hypothetical protein